MLSELDREKATGRIAAGIFESTGIRIEPSEITLRTEGNQLKLRAWGCKLMSIPLEKINTGTAADNIVEAALNKKDKLRKNIIRCKIEQLDEQMKAWAIDIRKSLTEKGVSPQFVSNLTFHIVDHGYDYNRFSGKEEKEYDYPFIALAVNGHPGLEVTYPINVYDTLDPVDMEAVKNELFITILEKALSQEKDLGQL